MNLTVLPGMRAEVFAKNHLLPIENLSIRLLLHRLVVWIQLSLSLFFFLSLSIYLSLPSELHSSFVANRELSSGYLPDEQALCLPSLFEKWVRSKDLTSVQREVLYRAMALCVRSFRHLSPEVQESEPLACSQR